MRARHLIAGLGLLCAAFGGGFGLVGRASAASIQHVGDLPGSFAFSQAWGVSGTGAVVVGESESGNGREAYRWTQAGGIVPLGDLAGGIFQSSAAGASADGSVVAGTGHSGNTQAFRWTSGGGMVGLGGGSGNGVSADGATVVGVTSAQQAFRWTSGGGMVALNPATFYSIAHGISADGTTIVGEHAPTSVNPTQAFRWTSGGGMVGLGIPAGAMTTKAFAASSDGSVVVGRIDSSISEAFRWTQAGGMVPLGDIPGAGFFSIAYGVSGNGNLVVGQGQDATGIVASIWDSTNGMRNLRTVLATEHGLNMTGWQLDEARAISTDGLTIVGNGFFNGQPIGWVATIPEPAGVGLWLVSAFFLARCRRRTRRAAGTT